MRKLSALLLLLVLALAGCGSTSSGVGTGAAGKSSSAPVAVPATSSPAMAAAASGAPGTSACPTSNTTSFAKTRFVADLGGAAFLIRRYLYQPYTRGAFKSGASGRTVAIVKATAATAASLKLLKNADENAKANPTLCKTIAAPLSSLIDAVGGLKSVISSGGTSALLGGLGGGLTSLLGKASSAGVPVTETPAPLG